MQDFPGTFARLRADHGRAPTAVIAASIATLIAWFLWVSVVPITIYEVSGSVRLERDVATFPIQATAAGRVVTSTLRVGQIVATGDALVELEVEGDGLHLPAERARAVGLAAQASQLRAEAQAEQDARTEEHDSAAVAAAEAESRIREASAETQFAESDLARMERLFTQGLVAVSTIQQRRADAQRLRARVATLEAAAQRVTQDQRTRDRERDVELARLASERAALDADARTTRANIARLESEVDRRRVRAPIAGTIGEAAQIRPGAVVAAGEKLGSIVPAGGLIAVAQFPAERALGRVRTGQAAVLRLAAYPWAEFGTVSAHVSKVASEIRDGSVRVELTLHRGGGFSGTLDHGMPGTVEIATERITPLSLVLRIAGQAFAAPR
jgi:membrane fusion protein (multidrug efflux system)